MLSMRYHGGFRANDDNYAPDGDNVDNDQLNRKLILNENINIPIPNALGFGWLPVGPLSAGRYGRAYKSPF